MIGLLQTVSNSVFVGICCYKLNVTILIQSLLAGLLNHKVLVANYGAHNLIN